MGRIEGSAGKLGRLWWVTGAKAGAVVRRWRGVVVKVAAAGESGRSWVGRVRLVP